jgi:hypothetical protein
MDFEKNTLVARPLSIFVDLYYFLPHLCRSSWTVPFSECTRTLL